MNRRGIKMKGHFLLSSNEDPAEGNVYAAKSFFVIDWLLREGLFKESFFVERSC